MTECWCHLVHFSLGTYPDTTRTWDCHVGLPSNRPGVVVEVGGSSGPGAASDWQSHESGLGYQIYHLCIPNTPWDCHILVSDVSNISNVCIVSAILGDLYAGLAGPRIRPCSILDTPSARGRGPLAGASRRPSSQLSNGDSQKRLNGRDSR